VSRSTPDNAWVPVWRRAGNPVRRLPDHPHAAVATKPRASERKLIVSVTLPENHWNLWPNQPRTPRTRLATPAVFFTSDLLMTSSPFPPRMWLRSQPSRAIRLLWMNDTNRS
jgi:hypothetical protein